MRVGTVTNMVGGFLLIFIRGIIIDVSCVVILDVGAGTLSDIVETGVVIASEFIVKGEYTSEVLTGEYAETTTSGASGMIAAELDANGFTVVIPALEFASTAPLEDPSLCSCTPCIRWPTTSLDCSRALRACKPSYHV